MYVHYFGIHTHLLHQDFGRYIFCVCVCVTKCMIKKKFGQKYKQTFQTKQLKITEICYEPCILLKGTQNAHTMQKNKQTQNFSDNSN